MLNSSNDAFRSNDAFQSWLVIIGISAKWGGLLEQQEIVNKHGF